MILNAVRYYNSRFQAFYLAIPVASLVGSSFYSPAMLAGRLIVKWRA
ncbi:MAG: hypothetical protein ACUVS4_15280 [Chloroflexaceae bacterium]